MSEMEEVRIGCTKDPECADAGGLCDDVRECGSTYPVAYSLRTTPPTDTNDQGEQ